MRQNWRSNKIKMAASRESWRPVQNCEKKTVCKKRQDTVLILSATTRLRSVIVYGGHGDQPEPPWTNAWQRQVFLGGMEPLHLLPRTMNKPLPVISAASKEWNDISILRKGQLSEAMSRRGNIKSQRLQTQLATIATDVPRCQQWGAGGHDAQRPGGEGMKNHCEGKL